MRALEPRRGPSLAARTLPRVRSLLAVPPSRLAIATREKRGSRHLPAPSRVHSKPSLDEAATHLHTHTRTRRGAITSCAPSCPPPPSHSHPRHPLLLLPVGSTQPPEAIRPHRGTALCLPPAVDVRSMYHTRLLRPVAPKRDVPPARTYNASNARLVSARSGGGHGHSVPCPPRTLQPWRATRHIVPRFLASGPSPLPPSRFPLCACCRTRTCTHTAPAFAPIPCCMLELR